MKGSKSNCLRCGSPFTKKKKDHKFCRSGCRTVYNRKKKGIAEPKFLTQGVNKPRQYKPSDLIPSNTVQIKTADHELLILDQQIYYYQNIINDAGKNVLPLYMIGGAGLGAVTGKNQGERLVMGILGGIVGSHFDANRKERIIKTAHENIKLLNAQKRQITAAKQMMKSAVKSGILEPRKQTNGVMKVITANEYKSKNIPSLGLDRNTPWHYLFGDPSQNFMAMLHGLPGNGKSTFSVQLADYFQNNHGDVLYIASEQSGLNKSLQDLLNQYATSNFAIANMAKDHTYDQILKASKQYSLVVLDSINHIGLSAAEFENIRDKSPNTAFLAIMQSKKDGDFKGTQEWAHNCDIIIEMRKMTAYQTKSRFAVPASIKIIR